MDLLDCVACEPDWLCVSHAPAIVYLLLICMSHVNGCKTASPELYRCTSYDLL